MVHIYICKAMQDFCRQQSPFRGLMLMLVDAHLKNVLCSVALHLLKPEGHLKIPSLHVAASTTSLGSGPCKESSKNTAQLMATHLFISIYTQGLRTFGAPSCAPFVETFSISCMDPRRPHKLKDPTFWF